MQINKQQLNNNAGVTIIEMLISIALFSFAIIAVMEIFVAVIDGQQNSIASRNLQESMRYTFEVMAKDIRMARLDETASERNDYCDDVGSNKVYDNGEAYGEDADVLFFRNYHNECMKYYLEDGRIKVDRDLSSAYLTPDEIIVSNLKFLVKDNYSGSHPTTNREQSIVTIRMDINTKNTKVKHAQNMKIQTSISSRYY